MSNVDKVTEYILKNSGKLTPEKIQALSSVVKALGGEKNSAAHEPNTIPIADTQEQLTEPGPIDFGEVDGVKIDDGNRKKIKIYPNNYVTS